jgi:glycine betaine/choline ABC-type transport system substrate-binding protein
MSITRRGVLVGTAGTTMAALAGCLTATEGDERSSEHDSTPVVLGSKRFTENVLLGWMSYELLAEQGSLDRVETDDIGERTTVENFTYSRYGTIQHYWEYTGTLETLHYAQHEPDSFEEVRELAREDDLAVLEPGAFNNTYEMVTSSECSCVHDLETISDFVSAVESGADLSVVLGDEFVTRDDGWAGLTEAYGMSDEHIREFNQNAVVVEAGDTYRRLEDGDADVIMGFSTDPELGEGEFVLLDDDREFFPVYNPVAVVHAPLLEAVPSIEESLNDLAARLDSVETMRDLISRVTSDGTDPQEVAREFVSEES